VQNFWNVLNFWGYIWWHFGSEIYTVGNCTQNKLCGL
jgi:hypothetical protein